MPILAKQFTLKEYIRHDSSEDSGLKLNNYTGMDAKRLELGRL